MAMASSKIDIETCKGKPFVYIATLDEASFKKGFTLLDSLRKSGIASGIDYEGRSLKAQMRAADKRDAGFVLIIGEEELKSSKVLLKNMKDKTQESIDMTKIIQELKKRLVDA